MLRTFPFSIFLLTALPALGAYPEFGGIQPRGGQRGTDIDVTFSGNRLDDAEEIVSYDPAVIKALEFKAENPTTIKVKLHIEANCPLGEHLFRVRTKSGSRCRPASWCSATARAWAGRPDHPAGAPSPLSLRKRGSWRRKSHSGSSLSSAGVVP